MAKRKKTAPKRPKTRIKPKDFKKNLFESTGSWAKLHGKIWPIIYFEGPFTLDARRGDTDAPTSKGKRIRIRKDQDLFWLMDTLTHEAIHGSMWHLDEETVNQSATDITHLQWDNGIRPLDAEMLEMWEARYGPKKRKRKPRSE